MKIVTESIVLYFLIFSLWYETGRQKILNSVVASIPRIKCAQILLISICYCRYEMSLSVMQFV